MAPQIVPKMTMSVSTTTPDAERGPRGPAGPRPECGHRAIGRYLTQPGIRNSPVFILGGHTVTISPLFHWM